MTALRLRARHVARYAARCAALLSLLACGTSNAGADLVVVSLRDPSALGALGDRQLTEASGVVRSDQHPGIFWSQNDSGNDAVLFAYDSAGVSRGATRVLGAINRDWEALASGPCTEGTCLYVGDVGDNRARRDDLAIWRIVEPAPGDSLSARATALRLRYSDGPRDVEAMWVGPDTTLWLLTKRPMFAPGGQLRRAQLYRVSASAWAASGVQVATLTDSLPIIPRTTDDGSWITDAALSPPDSSGARRVAIRTYQSVFVFAADARTGRPGALLATCSLVALNERHGEGLTWLTDGRLLFNAEGRGARLQAGRCP